MNNNDEWIDDNSLSLTCEELVMMIVMMKKGIICESLEAFEILDETKIHLKEDDKIIEQVINNLNKAYGLVKKIKVLYEANINIVQDFNRN